MSKMSKDFKTKSALRCMADGGMLGNAVDKLRGRANAIDNAEAAAVAGKQPTTAQPAPTPPPPPQGGMISDGVVSRPAPVAQPQPQPSLFSRLRKAVGMADGGNPDPEKDMSALTKKSIEVASRGISSANRIGRGEQTITDLPFAAGDTFVGTAGFAAGSAYDAAKFAAKRGLKKVGMASGGSTSPWSQEYATGTLGSAKPTPKVNPATQLANAIGGLAAQRPVTTPNPIPQPAGPVESTGGLAPAVAVPTAPKHSIATASTPIQTGDLGAVGDGKTVFGDATPQLSAAGYPLLRTGGYVRGPGGPREDKVGPVMLSDKEYVLPAKTVRAMGGPEELDEVVQATNDGRKPRGMEQREERGEKRGLRGYETGGTFYVDEFGNASEMPKRPPVAVNTPKPPVVVAQPHPGPEIDVTPPRQPGFENARDITSESKVVRPGPTVDAEPSRLRSAGGKVMRVANKWVAPAVAADSLYGTYKTPTEDYYTRFGIDPKADSNLGQFAKDVAIRTLGAASDLGDALTFGIAGNELYRDKQPKAPVKAPVNPWARDSRDVAPDSTLIAEERARQPGEQYLTREGVDTGGKIYKHDKNVFYGGTMGEEGRRLQEIEAQRGLARYKNDAEGMYATIAARIASGDLENANKLAWDSTSRAMVERGFADRMNARAQAAASVNQEDQINGRYDKQINELKKYFSSDRAKGNLARHIDALEGRRAAELGNLRNVNAQTRGQDMLAASTAARQASEQAIANQRMTAEQARMQMDQANRDREYQLNVSKYGTEVAKTMYGQKEARANKVQDAIERFAKNSFTDKDGKLDAAQAAAFTEFVYGSGGDLNSLSMSQLNKVMSDAKTRMRVRDRANENAGFFTGRRSTDYSAPGEARHARWSDITNGGMTVSGVARSKLAEYTFGNPDVIPFDNGQVRRVTDLTDGNDDLKAEDEVYSGSPLRRK